MKSKICVLVLLIVFMATCAIAGFEDSRIFAVAPSMVYPNTEMMFSFYAENASNAGDPNDWINEMQLIVPEGYVVDPDSVVPPPVMHPTGPYAVEEWLWLISENGRTVSFITVGAPPEYLAGDIRDGEMAMFLFRATTDSAPSGTFAWVLHTAGGHVVDGFLEIEVAGDDDDSDDDDDDDNDNNDIDDDDDDDASPVFTSNSDSKSSDGCGCGS